MFDNFVLTSRIDMEKTTLVFLSLKELWEFRQAIHANYIEINTKNKSITCECTREHIQLAIGQFHARLADDRPGEKKSGE